MRQKLSPEENRRAWLYAALIVIGLLLIAALVILFPGHDDGGPVRIPDESPQVLAASQGLDEITVDAVLDPEARLLTATQVMTLRNPAAQSLDQAVLRSWSGAYLFEETSPAATDELFAASYGERFSTGGLIVDEALINGEPVSFRWGDDRTVITLPAAWAADETLTVTLRYHVNIPACGSRFGMQEDIIALGNVFPVPALWDGSWRTDPYCAVGDPFVSACANWTVRLTVPEGYTAAATGFAEPAALSGARVYAYTAHAVRDFALAVSREYASASAMAGDVLVTAFARSKADAARMVKYARQAIACYEEHYGPYLYPTFTLAEVSFPYGGMEYPRMAMIASSALAAADDTLEVAVAHETAHQWWYAMVGSDSVLQPWQDEALCEYALMDYIGSVYGPSARANAVFDRIETALRITIPRGVTPGSPITYFQDLTEYTQVVYRRGAAMWMALESLMGKPVLDAALQQYCAAHRFGLASREDVTLLLSQAAGLDVAPLMQDYLDTYITN